MMTSRTMNIDLKRQEMIARLGARAEKRELEKKTRKDQRAIHADPKENATAWWAEFKAAVATFEANSSAAAKKHANKGRNDEMASTALQTLAKEVAALQNMVSDGARFLPKFDQKTAQRTVKQLERNLRETKSIIIPRKKFSFGKAGVGRVRRRGAAAAAATLLKADAEKAAKQAANSVVSFEYFEKTLQGEKNETLCVLPCDFNKGANDLENKKNSQDVALVRNEDCIINLPVALKGLRAHKLSRCTVFCGPIDGSVFIEDCTDCVFHLISRQIRIHNTNKTDFYVHVQSGPIIEDCDGLKFAPYSLRYSNLDSHCSKSPGISLSVNRWEKVKDFKWLRTQQSPHWSLLPLEERIKSVESDIFSVVDSISNGYNAEEGEEDMAGGANTGLSMAGFINVDQKEVDEKTNVEEKVKRMSMSQAAKTVPPPIPQQFNLNRPPMPSNSNPVPQPLKMPVPVKNITKETMKKSSKQVSQPKREIEFSSDEEEL